MQNLPLKTRLTLFAILVAVIPLFVFYLVFSPITFNTLEENAVQEMSMSLNSVTQTINASLSGVENIVSVAKKTPSFLSYINRLNLGLTDEAANRDLYDMADRMVLDEEHIETFFTVYNGKLHIINDRTSIGVDVSDRDYYLAAMSGQPFLTDVFVSRSTGNHVLVYAEPIYDGERVVAVIALALNFHSFVSSYLENISVGRTGYPWMIDSNGLVVYHPDPRHIQETIVTEIGLERLENVAKRMLGGKRGTGYYDYGGVEKLSVFGPVSNWHLALTIDKDEVFAHVNQLRRVILLTATLVVIGLLAVSFPFLNRSIVNPLREIERLVDRISEGDYKTPIEVKRKDDLGILAAQINEMARVLDEKTEKERVQNEAIRESEERLYTLISQTPAVIYSYKLVGGSPIMTYISHNVINVLGYEPAALVDSRSFWEDCIHAHDVQRIRQKWAALPTAGKISRDEYRVRDINGNYHWLHDEHRLVLHEDGMPQVVGAWWDITERKQAEQKISDYNLELEELYSQLDEEIEKAQRVHEKTMPVRLPQVEGISLAAHYQPAKKMGGDFYDVVRTGNKLLLYLSDVAGHGLEGAMLSVFIKEAIGSYISLKQEAIKPGKILTHLDRQYRRQNYPPDYFICIFLAVLDLETGEFVYASAGFQTSPLLALGNKGRLELGESDLPIMLNLSPELLDFQEYRLSLAPGSTLLFSTDGLPEQIVNGNHYNSRLTEVFYANSFLPPEAIVQLINEDFRQFNNGSLQGEDDITLLVMQLNRVGKKEKLLLESNLKNIDQLDEQIGGIVEDFRERDTFINVIHEMVANAIEHGNKFDPEKKVKLEIDGAGEFVYAVVEDEGEGHDWRSKIDAPLDYQGKNIRGRGIILSRMLSERLLYNEKGNMAVVMMRKEEK